MTRETSRPAQRLLLIALAFGIALRVADFFNCRTLSLDEARLAVNIAARSFRSRIASGSWAGP